MTHLVGINHVALAVGSVDESLAFLRSVFGELRLRGRIPGMGFVDLGDQFLALAEAGSAAGNGPDHVGIVVDDRDAVLERARASGVAVDGNRVVDPWGNTLEIVDYRQVQFTKAPEVLRALGLDGIEKTEEALAELREKGIERKAGESARRGDTPVFACHAQPTGAAARMRTGLYV